MTTKILRNDKEVTAIEWSSPAGFGHLVVVYNGKGGFDIDAEFMNLSTVVEILHNAGI